MNKTKARELRKNPTDAEKELWKHLRLRQIGGYKFRRQHPVGPYIVDFVCLKRRLIVEVDRGQHSQQVAYDEERSMWLEGQGFQILRFWDNEVLTSVDVVKEVIAEALNSGSNPHLYPPPQGEDKGGG
jgi:very-short-patch-repair endonuclease